MTLDAMIKIKESRGYSFAQLSDYTGVPVITLQRIFSGKTRNPRRATLDAIEKVLTGDESMYSGRAYSYEQSSATYMSSEADSALSFRESEPVYGAKKNGEYTIDDYYALPEDQWVELIDGYFYDMTAPRSVHQIISSMVFNSIYNYIKDLISYRKL